MTERKGHFRRVLEKEQGIRPVELVKERQGRGNRVCKDAKADNVRPVPRTGSK